MIDLFKRKAPTLVQASPIAICVWGAAGSPGKSTVAANLACELSIEGHRVLLVDLDTYSPCLSDLFGLIDHPPGLAAAARLVGQGRFDLEQIDRLTVQFDVGSGKLAILTGLSSPARWPEIGAEKIEGLVEIALEHFDFVILDVASSLESSIRQVGGAVDRNIASRTALSVCEKTIAVLSAEPIGVKRFLEAFEHASVLASDCLIVANRLRTSALGAKAKQQVEDAVRHFCDRAVTAFIPDDSDSCDRAVFEMVPLALMKRSSPARQAIAQFARLDLGDVTQLKQRGVAKLG
jgi:MinD-like ATPase involved in chromosome partitioning or flagellar assembly